MIGRASGVELARRSRPGVASAAALLILMSMTARPAAQPALQFQNENLRYSLNWPSGLSLGEADLSASRAAPGRWELTLRLDAAVPGFAIADRFRAVASDALCSIEFEKETRHGSRRGRERTTFDPQTGRATRVTLEGGGRSEIPISTCARDAVTMLYFLRRELALGRVPPPQPVLFGATYQARFEYKGVQTVRSGDERVDADRIGVTINGPAAAHSFEILFARDAARTPVAARIPLALGTLSLEPIR